MNGLAGHKSHRWKWFTVAAIVSIVLLFPVYWMFQTSVSPTEDVLSRSPNLVPLNLSFDAFSQLLSESQTIAWFRNSTLITVASAVVSTVAATFAGYALSRFQARGSQGITFFMLLGRILPGTLIALPFFVMFRLIGLMGTLPAVVIANTSMILPFATLLMKSYFDGIPTDIDNAARVDGCTRFAALWRVLLPISTTGITATLVFAATASWVDLLFARTLLFDEEQWTVPVGIASLIGDVETDWNQLMAAGTLSVLPVFVLYWFAQKYLVEGITAGAVKG